MEANTILYVAIWAAILLTGAGLLALAGFGLRNLTYGKVEPLSIVMIALPGIVFGVLALSMETIEQAGIITVGVMFALSLVGLVYTGVTNLFW